MLKLRITAIAALCFVSATIFGGIGRYGNPATADVLSIEDARAALADAVGLSNDEVLKMGLQALKTVKPQKGEGGIVNLGPWNVDLINHRFILTLSSGDSFVEYGGNFVRRDDGSWAVKIDVLATT